MRKLKPKSCRYQIAVTYRCPAKCQYCYTFTDFLPCPGKESDVTVQDIIESGKRLGEAKVKVSRMRFTGGEPVLMPNLLELKETAFDHWKPDARTNFRCYTNLWTQAVQSGLRRRISLSGKLQTQRDNEFVPFTLSPADLGIEPVYGFGKACKIQHSCGRFFNAYGFSACQMTFPFGRLFGIDLHSAEPLLHGDVRFCQHCIYSTKDEHVLWQDWKDGKIPRFTKTFQEALDRRLDEGPYSFKPFLEREREKPDASAEIRDRPDRKVQPTMPVVQQVLGPDTSPGL